MVRLTSKQRRQLCQLMLIIRLKRSSEFVREHYIHPLLAQRTQYGQYHFLVSELRRWPDRFKNYMRMTPNLFDELVLLVEPFLTHGDTHRSPIGTAERLAMTIRFVSSF